MKTDHLPIWCTTIGRLWMGVFLGASCLKVAEAAPVTYPLVPHHVQKARRHRALEELMGRNTTESLAASEALRGMPPSLRRRAYSYSVSTSAEQVGALYQGYGTHYIDLWCGSPPQRQTVIVDTGSGVTAFPCSGCKDCGVPLYHVDKLFVEKDSSTFLAHSCFNGKCATHRSTCNGGSCEISMSYAEGSRWKAYEATDRCYVGGPHEQPLMEDNGYDDLDPTYAHNLAFDFVFGCQTLVTGLFKTQMADGIMGMNTRSSAFWHQMYEAGKMGGSKEFGLCFSQQPKPDSKGTESGAFTLGGIDGRLNESPMVYTPGAHGGRDGFFSVKVRHIWLRDGQAGESAQSLMTSPNQGLHLLDLPDEVINKGGIIVDSGTTDTYWNRGISSAFASLFHELAGIRFHNSALPLSEEEIRSLPTILFQLKSTKEANPDIKDPFHTVGLAGSLDPKHPYDVILAYPPSHYMEYDPDTKKYTPRFYTTESRGSVLGANAMMGHNVIFDSDNDKIGWAESNCDYTNLVKEEGFDFTITGKLQDATGANQPTTSGKTMREPVASPTTSPNGGSPSSSSTAVETSMDHFRKEVHEFLRQCNTPECEASFVLFLLILGCCVGCFCCCCCYCRSKASSSEKFRPTEMEMVSNGGGKYRDEPREEEEDDDVDEMPRGSFKDEPEFEGDFA